MTKLLSISLCIMFAFLCITSFIVVHRGAIIEQQNNKIANLELDIAKYRADAEESKKVLSIYAEADKQSKEFEKELINDTNVDNLDVVPDYYILKQLQSD